MQKVKVHRTIYFIQTLQRS